MNIAKNPNYAVQRSTRGNSFEVIESTEYGDLLNVNPICAPKVCKRTTPAKATVVTAANLYHREYLEYLLNRLELLSMDYLVYDLGGLGYGIPFDGTVSAIPYRNIPCKPEIIRDALTKTQPNEFLLWLDADAIPNEAINLIRHDYDLCFSIRRQRSQKPQEGWINAGVIFCKNTTNTNLFLKLWTKITNVIQGDQYALNLILDNEKYKERLPAFISETKLVGLPTDIINNFYFDESVRGAVIQHFKANVRHLHPLHTKK